MRFINLVNNLDPSSLLYTISKFPDSQQVIDIIDTQELISEGRFEIISRLSSFRDLELIIGANQALKELMRSKYDKNIEVSLYVPYFLGARSDRKFEEGGVNYLKSIICPIINSQDFVSVRVLDPHSEKILN